MKQNKSCAELVTAVFASLGAPATWNESNDRAYVTSKKWNIQRISSVKKMLRLKHKKLSFVCLKCLFAFLAPHKNFIGQAVAVLLWLPTAIRGINAPSSVFVIFTRQCCSDVDFLALVWGNSFSEGIGVTCWMLKMKLKQRARAKFLFTIFKDYRHVLIYCGLNGYPKTQ